MKEQLLFPSSRFAPAGSAVVLKERNASKDPLTARN